LGGWEVGGSELVLRPMNGFNTTGAELTHSCYLVRYIVHWTSCWISHRWETTI